MVQVTTERELTSTDRAVIGQLLVETLAGEISQETWDALYELGNPLEIPQPYGHLIGFAQGYGLGNKELARELQDELRIVCKDLLDPNAPK